MAGADAVDDPSPDSVPSRCKTGEGPVRVLGVRLSQFPRPGVIAFRGNVHHGPAIGWCWLLNSLSARRSRQHE